MFSLGLPSIRYAIERRKNHRSCVWRARQSPRRAGCACHRLEAGSSQRDRWHVTDPHSEPFSVRDGLSNAENRRGDT
jgi:hypothetical protein